MEEGAGMAAEPPREWTTHRISETGFREFGASSIPGIAKRSLPAPVGTSDSSASCFRVFRVFRGCFHSASLKLRFESAAFRPAQGGDVVATPACPDLRFYSCVFVLIRGSFPCFFLFLVIGVH